MTITDVKGRKYIGAPLKYYFEDAGLRNARIGFGQSEETHLIENIMYNELRSIEFQVRKIVRQRRIKNERRNNKRYYRSCKKVCGNALHLLQCIEQS